MENKRTVQQWEREQGIMFLGDDVKPKSKISGLQFREMAAENNHVAVDYPAREQFLKDNGYEVTRENLLNNDLEPQEQPKKTAAKPKATSSKPAGSAQTTSDPDDNANQS